MTASIRVVLPAAIALAVAACGPFTMPVADNARVIVDATVGPAAPRPIHGLFMTARLSTPAGISVGSWDPTTTPTGVTVVPGDDRLAVWIAPPEGTTLCIDGPDPATSGCFSGSGPPIARCEVALTIPPVAVVTVGYAAIDVERCRLELVSITPT